MFSGVVNILGLTGSFFMLQVYDRVLASRSVSTLVALSLLAIALFVLQAGVDALRSQVLTRVGTSIDRDLVVPVHEVVMRLPMTGRGVTESLQPLRDLEALRLFMGSLAPTALFDLPWAPVYLLALFYLHPVLGVMTLVAMVLMMLITLHAERDLKTPTGTASRASAKRQGLADANCRNVEVIRAMGFGPAAARRFSAASHSMLDAQRDAADVATLHQNGAKYFRVMFQSLLLAVGAWLVIQGQMSGGGIIASSILSGRALGPIDMVIGSWKQVVAARFAHQRLDEMLRALPPEIVRTDLPLASKTLGAEGLVVGAPGGRHPLVRNVSFTLQAGDGLAILGPSGAGKSTLVRALVGAWPTLAGKVRLDGAPLEQWPLDSIARLIGYLPQDVELFEGTVAENIARLDPNAADEAVVAAARAANVHEMILRLPEGYQTPLGEGGHNLSVGQRQRIGLARALYGDPFLVVLDEPNAHLDKEGEAALLLALQAIRQRGGIVVLVAHRRGILASTNKVAFLLEGEMRAFGPRDETLAKIEAAMGARAGAPPPAVAAQGTPAQVAPAQGAPALAAKRPLVRVATPLANPQLAQRMQDNSPTTNGSPPAGEEPR